MPVVISTLSILSRSVKEEKRAQRMNLRRRKSCEPSRSIQLQCLFSVLPRASLPSQDYRDEYVSNRLRVDVISKWIE